MTVENFVLKKRYRLVPPDGGYGYVVLVAVAVNFLAPTMFGVCYGMIFSDFFAKLKMGTTAISLLTGTTALSVSVSGYLTGPLSKVMSRRKLALIGALFHNLGVIGTVFVNTQAQLIFCQGLLQGIGLGFLYNMSCTMLNDYFLEKRLFSVSIAQTLSAAAAMVAPMIVSWSMAEYGYRGTLIVVAAVGMQTFVASALLQPVDWHMKKVVMDDQEKLLLQMEKTVNELHTKTLQTPIVKLNEMENKDYLFVEKTEDKKPSVMKVMIEKVKDFMDWPLFKKFALTCACLGGPLAVFADANFIFFLAQFLYDMKWDNDQVKWAFSLIGFGDISGRIVLIFSSSWLNKLGSHQIYVIGLFIAIVTKLGTLWVKDYLWMLAIFTIMGLSRCIIFVLSPLVVSDSVEPEKFPAAMGISMMMFGIISIVAGPAVGAIRDATGDYTIMFLILVGILVATAVTWLIGLIRKSRSSRLPKSK